MQKIRLFGYLAEQRASLLTVERGKKAKSNDYYNNGIIIPSHFIIYHSLAILLPFLSLFDCSFAASGHLGFVAGSACRTHFDRRVLKGSGGHSHLITTLKS